MTPISPFRPRRWHGALLPDTARITIEVQEADKRPVAAVADHDEVRGVRSVDVAMDHKTSMPLLFDPGHSLDERILSEQFGYLTWLGQRRPEPASALPARTSAMALFCGVCSGFV